MTRPLLPGLQATLMLSPLYDTRPLVKSALPDAPVVLDDGRRAPRRSPGAARRALGVLRG